MWGFCAPSELMCFPGGSAVKNLQCRRHGFDPWVRKIPWRKGMATHSRILAWRIPWTEEPGWLQSIGLQRVVQDWSDFAHIAQHSELLKAVRGWDWEGACLQGQTTSREDRYYTLLLQDPHEPVVLNTWLNMRSTQKVGREGRGSSLKIPLQRFLSWLFSCDTVV